MEQEIINRIKEILDYYKLSPSKLADELSINRSRLSHILNGRNNPTLEVIKGILTKYNSLNPDWLLFGNGSMIRSGVETDPKDLFQFAEINKKKRQPVVDIEIKEITLKPDKESSQTTVQINSPEKINEKNEKGLIKRVTVYFSDNEYQDFISE